MLIAKVRCFAKRKNSSIAVMKKLIAECFSIQITFLDLVMLLLAQTTQFVQSLHQDVSILFDEKVNIWLKAGVQRKNNLRYININIIYNQLGETLCKALPAYHVLIGYDYSASFCRKGKVQPFKILKKDVPTQEVYGNLANMEEPDEHLKKSQKKSFAKSTERNILIKLTMYGHRYFGGNTKQRNQRNNLAAQRSLSAV